MACQPLIWFAENIVPKLLKTQENAVMTEVVEVSKRADNK